MPLQGALAGAELACVASMPDLNTEALDLDGVLVVHAFFEVSREHVLQHLPRALTPTIPASIYITGWSVPGGLLGAFRLVQVRLGCRAGIRGRGLLLGAAIDSPRAGEALEARWGLRCTPAEIEVEKRETVAGMRVDTAGRNVLTVSALGYQPISSAELQWVAGLHAARVASEGGRPLLVQVDPEYEFSSAFRASRPGVDYDPAFWSSAGVAPVTPIAMSMAEVRLHLPRLRYVIDPDGSVFDSTRRVG